MQENYAKLMTKIGSTFTTLKMLVASVLFLFSVNIIQGQSFPATLSDTITCDQLVGADGVQIRSDLETKITDWYNTTSAAIEAVLVPTFCPSATVTPSPVLTTVLNGIDGSTDPYCYSLSVTWALTDTCGFNLGDTTYTFTVLDTVGPVISGVPNDTTYNIEDIGSIPGVTGITALDDCSGTVVGNIVFDSTSTQGTECERFSFTITRSWSATDSCGNVGIDSMVITVVDTTAPEFDPVETAMIDTIAFDNQSNTVGLSILDTLSKYRPTIFTDNSGSVPFLVDSVDIQVPGACDQSFEFTREWVLEDSCGNQSTFLQRLIVIDTTPPTATFPLDTVIDCDEVAFNFVKSGVPTNIVDAADPNADYVNLPLVIGVSEAADCPNQDTLDVVWTVVDGCGNEAKDTQRVISIDTIPPEFQQAPLDTTITCEDGTDINDEFQAWLQANGFGNATDNCTDNVLIERQSVGGGSPVLTRVCPSPNSVIDSATVWFIAIDSCDNRDTATATFLVVDNEKPEFLTPASSFDQTLPTDPGECVRDVLLPLPQIQENCAIGFENVVVSETVNVTGPGAGFNPVNTVQITFDLTSLTQPINAESVFLNYELQNMDADDPLEKFDILGQDQATQLGVTLNTPTECGNITGQVPIPVNLFNLWASQAPDQFITLYFVPRVDPDNIFNSEINNICGTDSIAADLNIVNQANTDLKFEYVLNGGSRIQVPIADISSTLLELDKGDNVFEYFLTDCAGNISDPYSFTITIEDMEQPQLICPPDSSLQLTLDDNCIFEGFQLPLPLQASDNCPSNQTYNQLQPSVGGDGMTLDSGAAYLEFLFDVDNGNYKSVDSSSYIFTGLVPNALDDVDLQIIHRGNFDSQDYEVVVSANGAPTIGPLSLSGLLTDDCLNPHTATVSLTRNQYNSLAGANNGTIRVTVRQTTPLSLDGTNICNDTIPIGGGLFIDSSSFFAVNLTYTNWAPTYEGTGATTFTGQFEGPDFDPMEDLEQGITTISYTITDAAGLTATCSYDVTLTDNTAPTAVGQPGEVEVIVNPGQETLVLDPADFDGGSFDNCTAQGDLILSVNPAQVNCSEVANGDKSIVVTLTVQDEAGLTDDVQVNVRLVQAEFEPTFSLPVCSNDTLYLFANPPENFNGNILDFTYSWTGPNGFTSNLRNPIITNPTQANSGTYTVQIFGDQTGCSATEVVQVAVDDLTPDVISEQGTNMYCEGQTISLTTSIIPAPDRDFVWYVGVPGSGNEIEIQRGSLPRVDLGGGYTPGTYNFFLVIETPLCTTEPSPLFNVTVSPIPTAQPDEPLIEACEGSTFNLGTSQTGVSYQWTGPNGFNSTLANPQGIVASGQTDGTYELVVTSNGCSSAPAPVQVSLLNKPAQPEIAADPSPEVCEGTPLTLRAEGSPGADEYLWISPQLNTISTGGNNSLNLGPAELTEAGNWRVTTRSGQCFSDQSAPVSVSVFQNPNVIADAESSLACVGGDIELLGSPTLAGATYEWTGPGGVNVPDIQNPTIPNAQLASSGQYTLRVITDQGCVGQNSVDITVVEGVNVQDIIIDAPVCSPGPATVTLTPVLSEPDDGGFQYDWQGINGFSSSEEVATITNATILASGPYSLQVTDDNGCRSNRLEEVVSLSFAPAAPAIPLPPPGSDVQFCVGETIQLQTQSTYSGQNISYAWYTPRGGGSPIITTGPNLNLSDASLDDSGIYSVEVTVDGCTSPRSGTINIIVSEQPTIAAINNGPVCEGSELILTGSEVPGATYNWQGPGFSSTQRVAVIPSTDLELNEGTYELTVDLNGCQATTTTTVDILEVPISPDISANGPICVPKSNKVLVLSVDSFTAIPGATYVWDGPAGIRDTTTQLRDTVLTSRLPNTEGTYDFTLFTLANGCVSVPEVVQVTVNTVPDQEAFAGLDSAFCEGDLVRLNGDQPTIGTGIWTVLDPLLNPEVNITDPANAKTSLSGLLPGKTYTFRWSLTNGACTNYDQQDVNITVNANIPLDAGQDLFFCAGEAAALSAELPSEGTPFWTQPPTQEELGISLIDLNEPTTPVEGLQPGNVYQFTFNLETACGLLEDEVLLTVYDNAPFAGANFDACSPNRSAQLDAVEPQGGSSGRWRSPNANIRFSNVNDPKSTVFNLELGNNILIWELDNGNCGAASRDTVVVDMRQSPQATDDTADVDFLREVFITPLANDSFPVEGATITIVSEPEFGVVEVIGDTILYIHTEAQVGQDEFTYQIQSLDCPPSTATVRVNIGGDVQVGDCFIPSIITPNGDGVNDLFIIPCLAEGSGVTGNLVIFNRWGSELFNSENYKNNWQGIYQGSEVPAGVYFYRVSFSDPNEPPRSGYVYVKR